jgi:hypothetical protein
MAREGRTRRRLLAEALLAIISKTPSNGRAARIVQPSFPGDPYYVFVLLPWLAGMPEKEYRNARYNLLSAYCQVLKLVYPKAQDIVGIATESGHANHRSEDAIYLDASQWTEKHQKDAEEIRGKLSLFRQTRVSSGRIDEYPKQPKIFRNSKCPCGSGKKYKQCCGCEAKSKKRH